MGLTEDQIIKKFAKHCGHCNQNMLLPKNMNLLVSHLDSY